MKANDSAPLPVLNRRWKRPGSLSFFISILLGPTVSLPSTAQVTTSQYNNSRTGANLHETTLTPRNVNATQFGRLFSLRVDGDVYAQPLYMPRLQIPGKGKHDVIFVATEHDSVYAFDAPGQPQLPLWRVNFTNAAQGITTPRAARRAMSFYQPGDRYHFYAGDRRGHGNPLCLGSHEEPNDKESGIWAADTGPAADRNGNIFVPTGNGKFDAPQGPDYGDTLLKLTLEHNVLAVDEYFTPSDQAELNKADNDLGSGGPLLVPDQSGPHPHLVLMGGKDGTLYAIDRDHMGGLQRDGNAPVDAVRLGGSLLAAPAYWNQRVYVFANRDVLKQRAGPPLHRVEWGGTSA